MNNRDKKRPAGQLERWLNIRVQFSPQFLAELRGQMLLRRMLARGRQYARKQEWRHRIDEVLSGSVELMDLDDYVQRREA